MATSLHSARWNNVVTSLRASGAARGPELSCYAGHLNPKLAGRRGYEIKFWRWVGSTSHWMRRVKSRCSMSGSLTPGAFTPQAL